MCKKNCTTFKRVDDIDLWIEMRMRTRAKTIDCWRALECMLLCEIETYFSHKFVILTKFLTFHDDFWWINCNGALHTILSYMIALFDPLIYVNLIKL